MEIRFRLNRKNVKDKIIIDFLEEKYDAREFIKMYLYHLAVEDNKLKVREDLVANNSNLLDKNKVKIKEEFAEFFE